ncbi:hypothetical protein [Clostridium sp.]|uniref:hypothetical protein n=1 Tax=Clostridium sp. TaxID=1506 RepID=UPI003216A576
MNNCELIKKVEELAFENEQLKIKNEYLSSVLGEIKTWKGIRESVIIPKLTVRYGQGCTVYSTMANDIGQVVKTFLGVSKLTDIGVEKYDLAKDIATKITDIICEYEWKSLNELQRGWAKFKN